MSSLTARIVHLDESLAVVDKPAGLVVHPAPSHSGPTLVSELDEVLGGGGDPERPGIVHRLDKGTSGLLVVARTDEAHAALQAQVRRREVDRIYLALAGGRLRSRGASLASRRCWRAFRSRVCRLSPTSTPTGGSRTIASATS